MKPRPSLSWPKPTSMAQALVLEGRSQGKPSLAGSFQAEPSWHITRINDCTITNTPQNLFKIYILVNVSLVLLCEASAHTPSYYVNSVFPLLEKKNHHFPLQIQHTLALFLLN
jgi:hypothetical protein